MDAKVAQFVSVTGASAEVAHRLLEACGGNLDLAINMHLEGSVAAGAESAGATAVGESGPSTSSVGKSYEDIHGVRAPIPQSRGVLIEEEAAPTRVFRSRRLPRTVFDPFQDYSAGHDPTGGSGSVDKKKNLAELFKPPFDILFQGTFHEARAAGQLKKKWLMVNLQDSKEFASQMLNRDIWSNHNIKDIINEHFLFLQVYRITDDGVRFRQLYHVETYPYIAIIDPRTGEKMTSWNGVTVSEFQTAVHEFLASNSFDDLGVTPNSASLVDESEESQLEAAIRASLEQAQATSSSQPLTFTISDSEDEYYCRSSDMEAESDACCVVPHCGTLETKSWEETDSVTVLSSTNMCNNRIAEGSSHVAVHQSGAVNSQVSPQIRVKDCTVDITPVVVDKPSRKRKASGVELHVPRKALREDHLESVQQTVLQTDESTLSRQTRAQKGRRSNASKGKGKAKVENSESAVVVDSAEDQLASGAIGMESVTQLLIRLPDGSRLQKAFICHHPIQELFQFLELQGLNFAEHEVVTHFPRRSISQLQRSMSFRDAGLFPRETVFVHLSD